MCFRIRKPIITDIQKTQFKLYLGKIFDAVAEENKCTWDAEKKTRTFKDRDGNTVVERYEEVSHA